MATGISDHIDVTVMPQSVGLVRLYFREDYDVAGNYSTITITDIQGYLWHRIGWTDIAVNLYVDDTLMISTGMNWMFSANADTKLRSVVPTTQWDGTFTPITTGKIPHNADGSKTIKLKFVLVDCICSSVGFNGSNNEYSEKSITLTKIPRASSLSLSTSSVDVGSSITANISRADSSFTHTVEFYINDSYYQKYTGVATSKAFTIPTSWYNYMSSSTSCTAYCRITTYSGSTQIGSQARSSFTVNVPSSIVPTIGTFSIDPVNITTSDGTSRNIMVKGKNKINVSVSGCSAGTGSSIKSYKFDVLSGSTVIATNTTTSTSVSFGPFSQTGTLKFRITVTDNRGRSSSNSGSEQTTTCYDYYTPSVPTFSAYRANSSGTEDVNGTYLKCTYTPKYASVNSTNSVTITVYYSDGKTAKSVTGGTKDVLINLNGNTDSTYSVYVNIKDNYSGTSTSSTLKVFGQLRVINVTKDGTGFAVGKLAESNNLFDCRWPIRMNGFNIPEIQKGNVTITPSAANTPTGKTITFSQAFTSKPIVVATPATGVPGTVVTGVGISSVSTSSCTVYATRTNTSDVNIYWVAMN